MTLAPKCAIIHSIIAINFLVSEGKNYSSKAAWKAGVEQTNEPQKLIDSEEFWEEIEHLNIYNYAKKEDSKLGNVH